MGLKTTFDSTTNHLNLLPMFLNSLFLDPTVIDLISNVHMGKIWVEIAKKLKCGRPGGGGGPGSSVISDTPGQGGGGRGQRGVKKGQIFADVLYGWPLMYQLQNLNDLYLVTAK